ncbi:MAG: glycoside hydrolase family 125 protein [Bacillus sp. (in: Bacteria)]|nr:glycoside hydrolase family 125 protein [Bacillus sp. (in: firmicutes)]
MKKILTTPNIIDDNEQVFYTGNHYLSLPEIDARKASVFSLNIISTRNKGLIELRGDEALFQPEFYRNGGKLTPINTFAQMEDYHIPTYRYEFSDQSWLETAIYPDLKEKGFIYEFTSSVPTDIQLTFQPDRLSFLRFNSHELNFSKQLKIDKWLHNPLMDFTSNGVSFAMAFGASSDFTHTLNEKKHLTLSFNCHGSQAVYISLNADPDGASTNLIHLKRKEYRSIKEELTSWLRAKSRSYEKDTALQHRFNQNLFFNYFFAVGKDLDTDDYIAMTSRSPHYYVSGAFWERDSFLWSFPAIKLVDPVFYKKIAREHIIRHSRNAGDHAHYIDGTVLYPGFELDEAASHLILLEDFEADEMDPVFMKAIEDVVDRIEEERDPSTGLYKTFLMPSDDPSDYPFLTINNAILLKGYANLKATYEKVGYWEKGEWLEERMIAIRAGVKAHLMKEVNGKSMFVWSADGGGKYMLYNDPPGNIGLLPYYGLCDASDPVFINTVSYYYSEAYHYFDIGAKIQELACDHHPETPSGLGLCGSLLNPLMKKRALEWLKDAPMDYGLLAESFDKHTGAAKTGVGFATGCGYLAFALSEALLKDGQT